MAINQPYTARVSSRTTRNPSFDTAVLIDGSALYFALRAISPDKQLDYRRLIQVVCQHVEGARPPGDNGAGDRWVMWTAAAPDNLGQTRFLDFAERELHFAVRRFLPAESYMVEPARVLGVGSEPRSATRLTRFDASISFAIGRLTESTRVIVMTDSFALCDPLLRANKLAASRGRPPNVLAFFGSLLDVRWQRVLRSDPSAPTLLDLDEHEVDLFGESSAVRTPSLSRNDDEFLF